MTWYVSMNGDDRGTGSSPLDPWRTLRKLDGVKLGPADAVLLDATSRWQEPLVIRAAGSAEAPALVGSYLPSAPAVAPDGAAASPAMPDCLVPHDPRSALHLAGWDDGFVSAPRPYLAWSEGPVVTVIDSCNLIIRGLEIECGSRQTLYPQLDGVDDPGFAGDVARHPDDTVNYGIRSVTTLAAAKARGGPLGPITLEGNYVHGRGPDQNSEGILVSAETDTDAAHPTLCGVTIRGNLVENVGWRGIGTGMQAIVPNFAGEPWQAISDVTIEGNAARLIGLQGICAFNAHRVVMRRNLVDRAGWYRGVGAKWGPAGLWPWSCADVLIEFNEVTGMFDGNTGADATGIDIDWNSRDVVVRYNHCYANMGSGIVTMSCLRGVIERNRVEGNLGKVNLGPGQIALCDFQNARGPHAITGVSDVAIRANLIILDRDTTTALSTMKVTDGSEWEQISFTGNRVVFFDHARGQYAYDIGESTRVDVLSDNVFYGCDEERFRAVHQGRGWHWAEWVEAGNDQQSQLALLDDTSPSRIRDLELMPGPDGVRLRWTAATDSRSAVHHYNVYRGRRPGFPLRYLTLVGQPTDTHFTDPEPAPAGELWYAVESEDACGNRGGYVEIAVLRSDCGPG